MKFLKMAKVASSAQDANIVQIVNVDKIETIVSAADTCIVNFIEDATAHKTTITSVGNGKAVAEKLMNLLEKGHMTVYDVDINFYAGITTIATT